MHTHLPRRALTGSLAILFLLLGAVAVTPARAAVRAPVTRAPVTIDYQMVAESIDEAGYYIDSRAPFFRSDKALDLLRTAQERSTPLFVAVLPNGVKAPEALAKLQGLLQRKGTYVVLAGKDLRVVSTFLPAAVVNDAYAKAVKANPRRPDVALIAFVRSLPAAKLPPAAQQPGTLADAQRAAHMGQEDSEGGSTLLYVIGAAIVLAIGAGGFFLIRKRRKPASSNAASSNPASPDPASSNPAGPPAAPSAGPGAPGAIAPGSTAPGSTTPGSTTPGSTTPGSTTQSPTTSGPAAQDSAAQQSAGSSPWQSPAAQ